MEDYLYIYIYVTGSVKTDLIVTKCTLEIRVFECGHVVLDPQIFFAPLYAWVL